MDHTNVGIRSNSNTTHQEARYTAPVNERFDSIEGNIRNSKRPHEKGHTSPVEKRVKFSDRPIFFANTNNDNIQGRPRIVGTVKRISRMAVVQAQSEELHSKEEPNSGYGQSGESHSSIINPFKKVHPVPFALSGRRRSMAND